MALKCICFLALALGVGVVSGAPKKPSSAHVENSNSVSRDRISALYVKDAESGDLRFLTGSSNGGLNQFITQKQNLLEQLRPNSGSTFGTGSSSLGTGLGTLGTLSTGSFGTGLTSSSSSSSGVTPIIVNLGNGGTTSSSSSSSTPGVPGSAPIGDLLPQIIAQAVFNSRRQPNRGGGNRRRVVNNRRRPVRRGGAGGGKNPQVFVIRPN